MSHSDEIWIRGLDLPVRIGVPDEERTAWQTLQADVAVRPGCAFEEIRDDLAGTIDYQALANRLKEVAAERPRHLIETLAVELAACALGEFGARHVAVELRKRILPGVDHVAVRIERSR